MNFNNKNLKYLAFINFNFKQREFENCIKIVRNQECKRLRVQSSSYNLTPQVVYFNNQGSCIHAANNTIHKQQGATRCNRGRKYPRALDCSRHEINRGANEQGDC